MSNTDTTALLIADRAILTELAEQSKAFRKHTSYAFSNEKYPTKTQLVVIAKRKAKDAETASKVLLAVIASAKTEERHPNAFQDALEGDDDLVIEYFDSLAG